MVPGGGGGGGETRYFHLSMELWNSSTKCEAPLYSDRPFGCLLMDFKYTSNDECIAKIF